jgi:hypothetical protein
LNLKLAVFFKMSQDRSAFIGISPSYHHLQHADLIISLKDQPHRHVPAPLKYPLVNPSFSLILISIYRLYSADGRMIKEYGVAGAMRIGMRNRSTFRKSTAVPL